MDTNRASNLFKYEIFLPKMFYDQQSVTRDQNDNQSIS